MKAEQYYLISDKIRGSLITRIRELDVDGKLKVVISAAGSKSVKQRGLQWKWYTEVANAGIGGKHDDTKDGVHLVSKWRWAVPILLRDNEFFNSLYAAWMHLHSNDEDRVRWFIDNHVRTESFTTSQMAEFLTDFQRHYGSMVNLTDPSTFGLNK